MIVCEKCRYTNPTDSSRCISCGYLLNIPVKEHRGHGLLQRLQTNKLISESDWASFLIMLLIPLYNVYIVIRLGYFSKEESNIRNFCRALTGVFIGLSLITLVSEIYRNMIIRG